MGETLRRRDWGSTNLSANDVLIADLYESVLRPDRIPDVLNRINQHLDCDGLHLVGKDEESGSMFASVAVGSQIVGAEQDYLAHYFRIDPRLAIGLDSPTGVVVACHDFLDDHFVSRNEFYQDFLIPHGPRYVIGGNVYRKGGKNIHVAINHLVGRPRFSQEKRGVVSGFMYHLSRWANQLFIADEVRGAAAAGFFALESLGQGILILDDQQHVLFANRAANHLLGDVLTTHGFRRFWAFGGTLRELFKQVSTDRQARFTTAVHTVGGRALSLLFSLFPLPREQGIGFTMPKGLEAVTRAKDGGSGQGEAKLPSGNASILVLVRARMAAPTTGSFLYQQAFGLTAAEARLADFLALGQSPQDYADQAKVSIATVRTQIRALLAKTGAANLRALVVLLASLPKGTPSQAEQPT